LFHYLPPTPAVSGHGPAMLDLTPHLHQLAEQRLTTFSEAGKATVGQGARQLPEVHCSVSTYGLREGIATYVEAHDIDLIVMGTHGVQDGGDRFFGTNAAFLVGKVQTPLLILPVNAAFQPLKMVCFATKLREHDLTGQAA
jgi:nucleotide-binding universal stress UspA family protein